MRTLPLLFLGSLGCSAGVDQRGAWMRDVLVEADRVFLNRDPDLVAGKYARMAEQPYAFMRGTVPWYFADLSAADPDRLRTRFLTVPEATSVLILGDPHPENASTVRPLAMEDEPEPPFSVEFIDLDASSWGPWVLDLRRGAVGIRALGIHLETCDGACQDGAARGLAQGYAAVMLGERDDDIDGYGDVVNDYLDEADEEGPEQKRTGNYTLFVDPSTGEPVSSDTQGAQRTFDLSYENDDGSQRFFPLSAEESLLLDEILAQMAPDLPPGFRALDVVRRYGAGVSSLPALRFSVLYDQGSSGTEDDGVFNIREVLDPPARVPGRATNSPGTFENNGQRVDLAARTLWSRPDSDPTLSAACVGVQCFKSLSWTSWFQDIERDKVLEEWEDGSYSPEDLAQLGRDLGGILAREHRSGLRADGGDPGAAIVQDLNAGGGAEALIDEISAHSAADAAQLLSDYDLFLDLLDAHGPLLGAEDIVEHTP